MCGYSGIVKTSTGWDSKQVDTFKSASNLLNHRGPDFHGFKILESAMLSHNRLSILDLDPRSHQPFSTPDQRYQLLFNGEVYNYKELKSLPKLQGIDWKTTSDTEVVLNLIIHYGPHGLEFMNGFFSLCFYDAETNYCLLARDYIGKKPLFYHQTKDSLVFASEQRFFNAMGIEFQLNRELLPAYLHLGYLPADSCLNKSLKQLAPGHFLEYNNGEISIKEYQPYLIKQFTSTNLRKLLTQSVKDRLIADVDIGIFLSGGLDSSIIALLASEIKSDIQSYTISFPDRPYLDESQQAAKTAKHLGIKHNDIPFTGNDSKTLLDRFLDHIDEPFADSSSLAVFALCQKTAEHVKVALGGDGADELFGGYRKHKALMVFNQKPWLRYFLKPLSIFSTGTRGSRDNKKDDTFRRVSKFVAWSKLNSKDRYIQSLSIHQNPAYIQSLLSNPDKNWRSTLHWHSEYFGTLYDILLQDQNLVLPGDMLVKSDRFSMAFGLEIRSPFLDHRLIAHSRQLVEQDFIKNGQGKFILRDLFKQDLPLEVINGSKRGFEVPLRPIFMEKGYSYWIKRYFSPELIKSQGFFDTSKILALTDQMQKPGSEHLDSVFWNLLIFQNWWIKCQNR